MSYFLVPLERVLKVVMLYGLLEVLIIDTAIQQIIIMNRLFHLYLTTMDGLLPEALEVEEKLEEASLRLINLIYS
jgi:hypothetical protein